MVSIIRNLCVMIYFIMHSVCYGNNTIIEKPIVAVVCSYNNHSWSQQTLDSIFSQEYSNFRLIIVDDCSNDGNQQVIRDYIKTYNIYDRVTFIENKERKRKLFNLYQVLYLCQDDEIVVVIDGDDWLENNQVFSKLNTIYNDENIWFTYGQYKNVPASQAVLWGHKEMGYCRSVPKHIQKKHAYRYYSFIYMHLRSFRGWLFKLVKLQDLIADKITGFEGDFYPASNDVAMYFPMVEMAHNHIKFIPDILYIRNLYSDIVGFKVDRKLQTTSAREIRKKPCYPILFKPEKNRLDAFKSAQASVFIICKSHFSKVSDIIENIRKNMLNVHTIHIYFNDTAENKTICRKIKNDYPNVIFLSYNELEASEQKSLKNRLLDGLMYTTDQHIIISTDSFIIDRPIDVRNAIYELEKAYAYRLYLNRDESQIKTRFLSLENDICAWKFASSINGWKGINISDDIILCRKDTFLYDIKNLKFTTVSTLYDQMHRLDSSEIKLGLFYRYKLVRRL